MKRQQEEADAASKQMVKWADGILQTQAHSHIGAKVQDWNPAGASVFFSWLSSWLSSTLPPTPPCNKFW
jgi:hypothetical protein